jgi:hypothetical protein
MEVVNCPECEKPMSKKSLLKHRRNQHGYEDEKKNRGLDVLSTINVYPNLQPSTTPFKKINIKDLLKQVTDGSLLGK